MGSLGWPEILLLAVVIILLFGARRLPEIGKGLGEGIRGFRSAMKGEPEDRKDDGKGSGTGGGTK